MTENLPIIEHEKMSDIFQKYHIRNLPFYAVIHYFKEAEPLDARAHNHPFSFVTHILKGWYIERIWSKKLTMSGNIVWRYKDVKRRSGRAYRVKDTHIHQIIDMSPEGCYTIMLPEKHSRNWGFYTMPEGIFEEFKEN